MDNLKQLINKYIEATIKHGEATNAGNHKIVNKQYSIIKKIYNELKSNKDVGLTPLTNLLEYPNNYVRLWAAAHTLSFTPEKAEQVLMEISQKSGFLGLNA